MLKEWWEKIEKRFWSPEKGGYVPTELVVDKKYPYFLVQFKKDKFTTSQHEIDDLQLSHMKTIIDRELFIRNEDAIRHIKEQL